MDLPEESHGAPDDGRGSAALGRVVALLREARGLSREELAKATKEVAPKGISPSTVAKLEQGAKVPRPRTLAMLARALDVTTTDLYERADMLLDTESSSGKVNPQAARRIALGRKWIESGGAGALAVGTIGAALGGTLGGVGGGYFGIREAAKLGRMLFAVEERLGRPLRKEDIEVIKALSEISVPDKQADD